MQRWFWWVVIAGAAYMLFGRAASMPLEKLERFDAKRPAAARAETYVGGSCGRQRCMLVYVAPWCPQCRRAHGMILESVDRLEAEGIETTVVLGMDDQAALESYAADFPFPVHLDPGRKLYDQLDARGVPYFAVWEQSREIVGDVAGRPDSFDHLMQVLELPQ